MGDEVGLDALGADVLPVAEGPDRDLGGNRRMTRGGRRQAARMADTVGA
jgi:hypothetical protein